MSHRRTAKSQLQRCAQLLIGLLLFGCSDDRAGSDEARSAPASSDPPADQVCARLQEISNYNSYVRTHSSGKENTGDVKANLERIDELKEETAEKLQEMAGSIDDAALADAAGVVAQTVLSSSLPKDRLRDTPKIVQTLIEKCASTKFPLENASVLNLLL